MSVLNSFNTKCFHLFDLSPLVVHHRVHPAEHLPAVLHVALVADPRLRRMVRLRLRHAGEGRPQNGVSQI